jgi:hypothetical protein
MAWLVAMGGIFSCCGIWTLLIHLRASFAVLLVMAMVFFTSSFYVVAWVIAVSITIAREHERGTYDQLCLPPSGALGANWAICAASLHRNDALGWVNFLRKLITGTLLLIFLMILATSILTQHGPNPLQFLLLFLDITALAAASYIDHVQSIVLGCLIGMLTPTYVPRRLDARVFGAGLFLTLQLTVYASTWVFGFLLPDLLFDLFGISGWLPSIALVVFRVALFYALREAVILRVWRVLTERLNADPRGGDLVARFATGVE